VVYFHSNSNVVRKKSQLKTQSPPIFSCRIWVLFLDFVSLCVLGLGFCVFGGFYQRFGLVKLFCVLCISSLLLFSCQ